MLVCSSNNEHIVCCRLSLIVPVLEEGFSPALPDENVSRFMYQDQVVQPIWMTHPAYGVSNSSNLEGPVWSVMELVNKRSLVYNDRRDPSLMAPPELNLCWPGSANKKTTLTSCHASLCGSPTFCTLSLQSTLSLQTDVGDGRMCLEYMIFVLRPATCVFRQGSLLPLLQQELRPPKHLKGADAYSHVQICPSLVLL